MSVAKVFSYALLAEAALLLLIWLMAPGAFDTMLFWMAFISYPFGLKEALKNPV